MTDTHCHLDDPRFDPDREAVLERASRAGVSRMVTIGCDVATSRRSVEMAERYGNVWASVGMHPSDCLGAAEGDFEELSRLARHPRVVAIGECGLDFFRSEAPEALQRDWFVRQVELARQIGKPLVIHCREAFAALSGVLAASGLGPAGGLLHCFSGTAEQAREFVDGGLLIAFGGTVTFPKNDKGREAAKSVPLDSLLVETDAPYLAPQAFRGKRNEPAHAAETARFLASLRGEDYAALDAATDRNAGRLFSLAEAAPAG